MFMLNGQQLSKTIKKNYLKQLNTSNRAYLATTKPINNNFKSKSLFKYHLGDKEIVHAFGNSNLLFAEYSLKIIPGSSLFSNWTYNQVD